jgi:hypothetical protein
MSKHVLMRTLVALFSVNVLCALLSPSLWTWACAGVTFITFFVADFIFVLDNGGKRAGKTYPKYRMRGESK